MIIQQFSNFFRLQTCLIIHDCTWKWIFVSNYVGCVAENFDYNRHPVGCSLEAFPVRAEFAAKQYSVNLRLPTTTGSVA